jgi:hypothetical protein
MRQLHSVEAYPSAGSNDNRCLACPETGSLGERVICGHHGARCDGGGLQSDIVRNRDEESLGYEHVFAVSADGAEAIAKLQLFTQRCASPDAEPASAAGPIAVGDSPVTH